MTQVPDEIAEYLDLNFGPRRDCDYTVVPCEAMTTVAVTRPVTLTVEGPQRLRSSRASWSASGQPTMRSGNALVSPAFSNI